MTGNHVQSRLRECVCTEREKEHQATEHSKVDRFDSKNCAKHYVPNRTMYVYRDRCESHLSRGAYEEMHLHAVFMNVDKQCVS